MTAAGFRQILAAALYPERVPEVAVETGTLYGGTTREMAKVFQEVVTMEVSLECFHATRFNLEDLDKVTILWADSRDDLHRICSANLRQEPTLFYLDAHYCAGYDGVTKESSGEIPLRAELHAIMGRRNEADIIVVDDYHSFGKTRPELERGIPRDLHWEEITKGNLFFTCNPAKVAVIEDAFVMWGPKL